MDQEHLSELLTTSQVARRLDVSVITVRQWLRTGALACVETPYGRLVDPSELKRFAEARQVRGAGASR